MTDNYKYTDITSSIIKAFYTVYNKLGYGFLKKVYENALLIELRKVGLQEATQIPIKVHYEGVEVGNYFADVLIEIKTAEGLIEEHEAHLVNYLKATNIEVGLLNFVPKAQFKIKVFSNEFKTLV